MQDVANPGSEQQGDPKKSRDGSKDPSHSGSRPMSAKPSGVGDKRVVAKGDAGSPSRSDSIHSLRQTFQASLNKISQNDTRDIGLKEIQSFITDNPTPQCLRIYFSCLLDQKRNFSPPTKEVEVLILGFIASVYKKNLLDPMDKPPSFLKSIVRLCEGIHNFFKETNNNIQLACARALNEVYLNCLADESTENGVLIMFEPLYSILNGGADRATQHTATICLCEFINLLHQNNRIDILDYVSSKIFGLMLKTNHDYPELLRGLTTLVSDIGLKYLQGKPLVQFADKILNIVKSSNGQNQYYINKVEACQLLAEIGKGLQSQQQDEKTFNALLNNVLPIIQDAAKNKIFKVQQAGAEAVKIWNALKNNEKIPDTKSQQTRDKSEDNSKKNPDGQAAQNFRAIRDKFKQEKLGSEPTSTSPSKNIFEFLQAPWGQNRGQNYTKARSGTGGGYVGWSSPPREDKLRKSHEKMKKGIKELILQAQGEGRPQTAGQSPNEKFAFVGDVAGVSPIKKNSSVSPNRDPSSDAPIKKEKPRQPGNSGNQRKSEPENNILDLSNNPTPKSTISGRSIKSKKYGTQDDNSSDSCFKDVLLQTQSNDISGEEQPQIEKVTKKAGASQIKAEAVNQPKPMAVKRKAPSNNNQQDSKQAQPQQTQPQQPIEDVTADELQALDKKAANALGISVADLQSHIEEKVVAKPKPRGVSPPPQMMEKKPSKERTLPIYKAYPQDEQIGKALKYVDDQNLESVVNGIEEYHMLTGAELLKQKCENAELEVVPDPNSPQKEQTKPDSNSEQTDKLPATKELVDPGNQKIMRKKKPQQFSFQECKHHDVPFEFNLEAEDGSHLDIDKAKAVPTKKAKGEDTITKSGKSKRVADQHNTIQKAIDPQTNENDDLFQVEQLDGGDQAINMNDSLEPKNISKNSNLQAQAPQSKSLVQNPPLQQTQTPQPNNASVQNMINPQQGAQNAVRSSTPVKQGPQELPQNILQNQNSSRSSSPQPQTQQQHQLPSNVQKNIPQLQPVSVNPQNTNQNQNPPLQAPQNLNNQQPQSLPQQIQTQQQQTQPNLEGSGVLHPNVQSSPQKLQQSNVQQPNVQPSQTQTNPQQDQQPKVQPQQIQASPLQGPTQSQQPTNISEQHQLSAQNQQPSQSSTQQISQNPNNLHQQPQPPIEQSQPLVQQQHINAQPNTQPTIQTQNTSIQHPNPQANIQNIPDSHQQQQQPLILQNQPQQLPQLQQQQPQIQQPQPNTLPLNQIQDTSIQHPSPQSNIQANPQPTQQKLQSLDHQPQVQPSHPPLNDNANNSQQIPQQIAQPQIQSTQAQNIDQQHQAVPQNQNLQNSDAQPLPQQNLMNVQPQQAQHPQTNVQPANQHPELQPQGPSQIQNHQELSQGQPHADPQVNLQSHPAQTQQSAIKQPQNSGHQPEAQTANQPLTNIQQSDPQAQNATQHLIPQNQNLQNPQQIQQTQNPSNLQAPQVHNQVPNAQQTAQITQIQDPSLSHSQVQPQTAQNQIHSQQIPLNSQSTTIPENYIPQKQSNIIDNSHQQQQNAQLQQPTLQQQQTPHPQPDHPQQLVQSQPSQSNQSIAHPQVNSAQQGLSNDNLPQQIKSQLPAEQANIHSDNPIQIVPPQNQNCSILQSHLKNDQQTANNNSSQAHPNTQPQQPVINQQTPPQQLQVPTQNQIAQQVPPQQLKPNTPIPQNTFIPSQQHPDNSQVTILDKSTPNPSAKQNISTQQPTTSHEPLQTYPQVNPKPSATQPDPKLQNSNIQEPLGKLSQNQQLTASQTSLQQPNDTVQDNKKTAVPTTNQPTGLPPLNKQLSAHQIDNQSQPKMAPQIISDPNIRTSLISTPGANVHTDTVNSTTGKNGNVNAINNWKSPSPIPNIQMNSSITTDQSQERSATNSPDQHLSTNQMIQNTQGTVQNQQRSNLNSLPPQVQGKGPANNNQNNQSHEIPEEIKEDHSHSAVRPGTQLGHELEEIKEDDADNYDSLDFRGNAGKFEEFHRGLNFNYNAPYSKGLLQKSQDQTQTSLDHNSISIHGNLDNNPHAHTQVRAPVSFDEEPVYPIRDHRDILRNSDENFDLMLDTGADELHSDRDQIHGNFSRGDQSSGQIAHDSLAKTRGPIIQHSKINDQDNVNLGSTIHSNLAKTQASPAAQVTNNASDLKDSLAISNTIGADKFGSHIPQQQKMNDSLKDSLSNSKSLKVPSIKAEVERPIKQQKNFNEQIEQNAEDYDNYNPDHHNPSGLHSSNEENPHYYDIVQSELLKSAKNNTKKDSNQLDNKPMKQAKSLEEIHSNPSKGPVNQTTVKGVNDPNERPIKPLKNIQEAIDHEVDLEGHFIDDTHNPASQKHDIQHHFQKQAHYKHDFELVVEKPANSSGHTLQTDSHIQNKNSSQMPINNSRQQPIIQSMKMEDSLKDSLMGTRKSVPMPNKLEPLNYTPKLDIQKRPASANIKTNHSQSHENMARFNPIETKHAAIGRIDYGELDKEGRPAVTPHFSETKPKHTVSPKRASLADTMVDVDLNLNYPPARVNRPGDNKSRAIGNVDKTAEYTSFKNFPPVDKTAEYPSFKNMPDLEQNVDDTMICDSTEFQSEATPRKNSYDFHNDVQNENYIRNENRTNVKLPSLNLNDSLKLSDSHKEPRLGSHLINHKPIANNLEPKRHSTPTPAPTDTWKESIDAIKKGNHEGAYSKILGLGDDLYLLRLMKVSGPCLQKLNRVTALKLMKRIIMIQKSGVFDKMALSFYESAHYNKITHNMKIEEQNKMLNALYDMSAKKDPVGPESAQLYKEINTDLKTVSLQTYFQ